MRIQPHVASTIPQAPTDLGLFRPPPANPDGLIPALIIATTGTILIRMHF